MKIAVCITTHNRNDILEKSLREHKKFLPKNGKLFIVDDASETPPRSDYRFEKNVGVSQAKNKCLELAEDWGADHIFLFDSDCYPISEDWWKPYVESKEPHLMYIFEKFRPEIPGRKNLTDCHKDYVGEDVIAYSHARGCMIYIDKKVLEVVGGFDPTYGTMYEHGDWTNRIHSAGLTTFRIMDVHDSDKLIHSMDEWREVSSSIDPVVRGQNLRKHRAHFSNSWSSDRYCEYRSTERVNDTTGQNNIILTSYLTQFEDAQRHIKWKPNKDDIKVLKDSADKHNIPIVVLNDCFPQDDIYKRVESKINPYFQRWIAEYRYLRDHPEIDNVFVVDSTDVEVLHNPFPYLKKGIIYVGDEPQKLGTQWMVNNSVHALMQRWVLMNRNLPLLNCGVVGGSREDIMKICHDIVQAYMDDGYIEKVDMPVFNKVMYTKWRSKIDRGRHVTTEFKKYQTEADSFFRHK